MLTDFNLPLKQNDTSSLYGRYARGYSHGKSNRIRLDLSNPRVSSSSLNFNRHTGEFLVIMRFFSGMVRIWISPKLSQGDGDSVTGFRRDLIEYLCAYNSHLSKLDSWIEVVKKHDFSCVRYVSIKHKSHGVTFTSHLSSIINNQLY